MSAADAPHKDAWFVAADGKSYGPYTEEQLKGFIGEGRVAAQTQVMRAGETWSAASAHPQLAWIFARGLAAGAAPVAPPPMPKAAPAPVPALDPASAPAAAPAPVQATPGAAAAPAGEAPVQDLAKVIIVAELRTGSTITFDGAVSRLGEHYRVNQYTWFLHTPLALTHVRKELIPFAGKNDPIFIADTTHGRTSWINFGPGAEATIKQLWRGGT